MSALDVSQLTLSTMREEKVKPKLRGVSHFLGFSAALGGLGFLMLAPAEGAQYWAGVLYGVSLCVMFGSSALYHRPMWSQAARHRLRLVDHAGIFSLIAGTYTPLAVLSAHGHWSASLTVMWAGAMGGMLFVVFNTYANRALRAAVYVVLGLWAAPMVFGLHGVLGTSRTVLLLIGSAIYILGAAVYARRWPNPRPATFGYHEVFHVMVIISAAFHYAVVIGVQYGS